MSLQGKILITLGIGAALAQGAPAIAASGAIVPTPPAGPATPGLYSGAWQGEWQANGPNAGTYRGNWNGSYDASQPAPNIEAQAAWLGECQQRLTASGKLSDQGKIAEACASWLAYFQAVGPNQPNYGYAVPVMLVPVVTYSKDCVTEVRVERPTRRHLPRRAPVLRDKRVRVLPD